MKPLYEDREAAAATAERLKVFAQPQRLMILSCLLRSERSVGEIAEGTGIGQPALSQQLGELRRAGLVQTRKEAKQVWYRLSDDDAVRCVRTIEAVFAGVGEAPVIPPAALSPAEPRREGVASFARILR